MQKLMRLRRAYPIAYSTAVGLVSVLLIMLSGLAVGVVAGVVCPQADYYVLTLIQEALGFALVYGVVRVSGFGAVLRQRGCGFLRGLDVGLYPLVLITLVAISSWVTARQEGLAFAPWYRMAAFCGTMLLIGLAEELPFRGLICGILLERFGTDRTGVWKTVLLSGGIFGVAHLTNLLGADPLGVFVQATVASVLGMLFAAIYLRTGNLWVTVVLHALMDFAGLLSTGLFESGAGDAVAEAISSYGLINLLPVITYGIPTVFLLRKKKMHEIQTLWTLQPAVGDENAPQPIEE